MKGGAVKPRAHVVFDYAKWEQFVRVWQASTDAEAAAASLGLSMSQAKSKAAALRKLGVGLRRFRAGAKQLSTDELNKLKAVARSVLAQSTMAQPGK